MLDYYSNFSPPSRPDAIEEVIKACTIKISLKKLSITDTVLRDTTTQIVNDMPSLGSYTGWYVGFKNDAIQMVMDKLTDCKSVE
jgi:hypothetical protein